MKDLYTILNLKTKQAKVETIEILGGKMPKRFSSVKILNKATKLEEEYQIYYDKKFNMYAIRDEDYSIMDSILAQRIMQVRETEFHAGAEHLPYEYAIDHKNFCRDYYECTADEIFEWPAIQIR